MVSRSRAAVLTVFLTILTMLPAVRARAQNLGPLEAVGPDGSVRQELALTAAQRSAIYNAVVQQRLRPAGTGIPVTIGAPVPRSAELHDLPNPAAAGDTWIKSSAGDLKYAMVEDDIVVVDPLRMQVVEIIHGGAKP
jgi:Protein of unknown function (DUF1236)